MMKYTQMLCVIIWFMSIQVFSSDDPKENTGLADTKITDTTEEEKMMNSDMELIKVMEENEEEKNHYQLEFIPIHHDGGSKIQPKNAETKRPNKRRELIITVIYLLKKCCGFGSRRGSFIFSLIFQFLDVSVPENGIIDDAGVVPRVMELSSDYHWLVTAGSVNNNNNFIKIWSMTDGSLKHDLDPAVINPAVLNPAWDCSIKACLFTFDNKRLISAHSRFVRIWSVTTGELIHTFPRYNSMHVNCILSPDGQYVLWDQRNDVINQESSVYMWSLETFVNVGIFVVHVASDFQSQGHHIFWMNFRNFNQELITSGADNIIRVWDVETQKCKRTLIGHSYHIRSCSLSQNQQVLVSCSSDTTAKIWNIDTEENIQTFYGHANQIEQCFFVNDDKWVASMDSYWTVYLWRIENGSIVHRFSNTYLPGMGYWGDSKQSFWVHINTRIEPNENLLLAPQSSAAELGTELQIVDVESGRTMFMFNVNDNKCKAMMIDGRILMSSDQNAIRFWNLENEAPKSDHQDKNKE